MKGGCRNCGYYGLYEMITGSDPGDSDLLLEFRWSMRPEPDSSETKVCTLYVDGLEVTSDSVHDENMRAICLGEWFEVAFKDRLMKLETPVTIKNGETIQGYDGLIYLDSNHERHSRVPFEGAVPFIDGAMGMSAVDTIMQACGFQLQFVYGTGNHEVYRLAEIPEPKEQGPSFPS